jgi:uncharacterized UBP type Zn finger protein
MAESKNEKSNSSAKQSEVEASAAAPSDSSVDVEPTAARALVGDEDDLVPVPVKAEILSELLDMGFSDVRARKGIVHGKDLDGALAWLDAHQEDPDIDQPYLVRREDAEREERNAKPLTEEEKAQKIKEYQEKAKRLRAEREAKEKEEQIKREKDRRERGQKMGTMQEERDRMMRNLEMQKMKKEKEVRRHYFVYEILDSL